MAEKYFKYATKNAELLNQYGGANCLTYGFQQHYTECWNDAVAMMLMQSDLVNREFIANIEKLNVKETSAKLNELFSDENISRNAYLLPKNVYIYYVLLGKYKLTMRKKMKTFLERCAKYAESFKSRALSRLKHDFDMYRYSPIGLSGMSKFGPRFEKELIRRNTGVDDETVQQIYDDQMEYVSHIDKTDKRTKLLRRNSLHRSTHCSLLIKQLYDMFEIKLEEEQKQQDQIDKFQKKVDKRFEHTGFEYYIDLAVDILNLYVLGNLKQYFACKILYTSDEYDRNVSLSMLEMPNLIGCVMFLINNDSLISSEIGHYICAYQCNANMILYDNESESVQQIDWKTELKKILQGGDDIFYNNRLLSTFGFRKPTDEELTDFVKRTQSHNIEEIIKNIKQHILKVHFIMFFTLEQHTDDNTEANYMRKAHFLRNYVHNSEVNLIQRFFDLQHIYSEEDIIATLIDLVNNEHIFPRFVDNFIRESSFDEQTLNRIIIEIFLACPNRYDDEDFAYFVNLHYNDKIGDIMKHDKRHRNVSIILKMLKPSI